MGIIRIVSNNPLEQKYILEYDENKLEYEFTIEMDSNETLNEEFLLSKREEILESIYEYKKEIENFDDQKSKSTVSFLNEIKGRELEYILNSDILETDLSNKELNELLNNNNYLKTKNVIVRDCIGTDYKKLKELETEFNDNINNFLFSLEGNTSFIDYQTCKQTLELINSITSNAINYGFSPLEQLIYVYDCVRNRIYKKEDCNEEYEDSRDLSNVLLGDKIVCLGYANIIQKILTDLSIDNRICNLIRKDNSKKGHARNIVYLKDEKYNIDGVYSLDATWNSRKTQDDNSFYNDYSCFCLTSEEMKRLDNNRYEFNNYYEINSDIKNTIYNELLSKKVSELSDDLINNINYVSRFIDKKTIIYKYMFELYEEDYANYLPPAINNNELMRKINKYNELYDKRICGQVFMEALFNVRKYQYYENPQEYPFSREDFIETASNSRWHFSKKNESLLFHLFKINMDPAIFANEYADEMNLDLNINRVKLSYTLTNLYNGIENANKDEKVLTFSKSKIK